jgi:hypothetical protein
MGLDTRSKLKLKAAYRRVDSFAVANETLRGFAVAADCTECKEWAGPDWFRVQSFLMRPDGGRA